MTKRLQGMIAAARVMAAQEVRAYLIFEVRGANETTQAAITKRIGVGGVYCALVESMIDDGKNKICKLLETDALEFTERFRATPPQWN